jgi:hypothetical protein
MKKILLLLAFASTIGVASAQKLAATDVPQAVKASFAKLYPSASDVKWEKENGKFEAEFKLGKIEQSVLLNANGQLEETEVEIDVKSLPATAQEYVKKHYPNEPIKEAAKITDAKGIVTYEAELKGKDIIFDAKGNFIKETK